MSGSRITPEKVDTAANLLRIVGKDLKAAAAALTASEELQQLAARPDLAGDRAAAEAIVGFNQVCEALGAAMRIYADDTADRTQTVARSAVEADLAAADRFQQLLASAAELAADAEPPDSST